MFQTGIEVLKASKQEQALYPCLLIKFFLKNKN